MTSPERLAYAAAWREREASGDTSPDLLLAQLRRHGADPSWLDADSRPHAWLLGCWERDVPPRLVWLEASKEVARLVPEVVRPLVSLVRAFR